MAATGAILIVGTVRKYHSTAGLEEFRATGPDEGEIMRFRKLRFLYLLGGMAVGGFATLIFLLAPALVLSRFTAPVPEEQGMF